MTTQSPAAKTSGKLVRIWRSTAIAPLTPSSAPAAAASSVSGRTPTTTRTMSVTKATSLPSLVVTSTPETTCALGSGHAFHGGTGAHVHPVLDELIVYQRAKLRIDRGEYLGELLDLGDRQTPGHQGLGHLQADVAAHPR